MNFQNDVTPYSCLDEFIYRYGKAGRQNSSQPRRQGPQELSGLRWRISDNAETGERLCGAGELRWTLLFAVERKKELLAFVDAVGVRDFRIGLNDAAPGGGFAVLRLGDLCQGIALLDDNFRIRFAALQS